MVLVKIEDPDLNARRRELLLRFAQYCALRIERVLNGITDWELSARRTTDVANVMVRARRHGVEIEVHATAPDLAGAIWNAMCGAEQQLCEAMQPLALGA